MGGRRSVPHTGISAAQPVAVAARAVIAAQLNVLERELGHARAGTVEGVHQLRVATRRMRAALVMFRDVLPRRAAATLERELAALGRKVGAVRDLHVLATAGARR